MKLLILGAFGKGALENYYLQGLKATGADCDYIDITDVYYKAIGKTGIHRVVNKIIPSYFFGPINKDLLNSLSGKYYDAIIVFKGLTLFPETVKSLKNHGKLVCCYNPDHPFRFFLPGSGNKNILESIKLYDLYISYSKKIVAELEQSYNMEAFVLPFGFDDRSTFSGKPFAQAIDKFSFIGAYDKERSAVLERLLTDKLVLFGDSKWSSRTSPISKLRSLYKGQSLYGQDYIDGISSSDAVFNFLRQQNLEEGSHNMRTFEVPGYGGLMISNRTEEQLDFFEEDKEAIYFDTIEELNDKVKFLTGKAGYIQKMKEQAMTKSKKAGFGYTHRAIALYEKLKQMI